MHKKNARALSLIVSTLAYLMIGAAIFDALESEMDLKKRNLVENLTKNMIQKYNFSQDDFKVLQTVVIRSIPHKAGHQWKFTGALYFAIVVVTTVGYGQSTPATKFGKLFCMLYALGGIPLNLVMFQSIGERLNTFIFFLLNKAKKFFRLQSFQISQTFMILVSTTMGTMVILSGAYLFHKYENWTLFEAIYYCFITLSTIGFGDYVAIQKNFALQTRYDYVIFSLLFILFGLALFSAAVNLMVLRFMTGNAAEDVDLSVPRITATLSSVSDDELNNKNFQQLPNNSFVYRTHGNCPVHGYNRTQSAFTMCLGKEKVPNEQGQMMKYTVRRSPGRIEHLVSNGSSESNSMDERLGLSSGLSPELTYAVYEKSVSITSTV